MCANDATLPFFFACACYFQFRPGRQKVLCANRARRRSVCYFRSIFFPMIAGLICRPLLFSSRRFSGSASVGADSSRYSVTASNDACFFLDSNMPTYISTIVADLLIHRRLRKRTIPRLQTFFPPSPLLPRTPTTTRSAMRGYLLRALSKPTNVHQCSK